MNSLVLGDVAIIQFSMARIESSSNFRAFALRSKPYDLNGDTLALVKVMTWQQAIAWANVDPELCRHMSPLSQYESTHHNLKWSLPSVLFIHCFLLAKKGRINNLRCVMMQSEIIPSYLSPDHGYTYCSHHCKWSSRFAMHLVSYFQPF